MWRFYLAATILVAVFIFAITLRRHQQAELRVSASPSGTPSAPRSQTPSSPGLTAVRGDAPWALSALPDCAHQYSETRGTLAFVTRAIPHGATAVSGHLQAGPCSIDVVPSGILIVRGKDRLRIPPPARLLYEDGRYYLYEHDRKDAVLRVYSLNK
ncbi:MAG: hypothetical protein ACRENA_06755 [Vulcanimicrobiaceae bacterium]